MTAIEIQKLQALNAEPTSAMEQPSVILDALKSADIDQALVVEVLENCGPPTAAKLDEIATFLANDSNDQAYWAATLLSRCDSLPPELQKQLLSIAANTQRDAAVRQRVVLALQRPNNIDATIASELKKIDTSGDVRLERLVAQVAA